MTKFQTLEEVRNERQKLYLKKEMLENEISKDFDDIKESLKPLNMIRDLFTPDNHAQNGKPISPVALNIGSSVLDLLVSKLLFNKSSYIKKIFSSYFIHAAGPSVLQKFAPAVIGVVKNLIENFKQKKDLNSVYEQSTAGQTSE